MLLKGNCLELLATLPDNSVDSIVTDPPYGLSFMGKSWDGPAGMLGQIATGDEKRGAYAYGGSHSRGYIDNDNLAFQAWTTEWAIQALRVLKPGGHLLAFGGSRTYHRLASAVEDAGFEIRDQIMWLYGSGFPKSHNVSKGIDKSDAVEMRRQRDLKFTEWMRLTGITSKQINDLTESNMGNHYLTDKEQPLVATAEMFNKLRPFLPEVPEWVEQMVRERTIESENFKKREVVGVQKNAMARWSMDETRFADRDITAPATPEAQQWQGWGTALKPAHEPIVVARKPLISTVATNVLTYGTGALNIDGSRVETTEKLSIGSNNRQNALVNFGMKDNKETQEQNLQGRWPANVIHDGSEEVLEYFGEPQRFFYCAKASKSERNAGLENHNFHPTVKPIALMRYLVKLVTPPNGTVLDPFLGSGTTAVAAILEGFNWMGCEMTEDYWPIIEARVAWAELQPKTLL